jgi:hypothetical protein
MSQHSTAPDIRLASISFVVGFTDTVHQITIDGHDNKDWKCDHGTMAPSIL